MCSPREIVTPKKSGVLRRTPAILERLVGNVLLTRVSLDFFVDLPLHGFKVEARRRLHGREFHRRRSELEHRLLHQHEAPELTAHEIIHVAAASIVEALTAS